MMIQTFRRDVGRTIDRFREMPLSLLSAQFARAVRLHLSSRTARPIASRPRPERVVVSLSTIPARARFIGPALRSLLDQDEPADRIILALPRHSRRDGAPYPEPETLRLPPGIDILRCEDAGPATKFLSALRVEPGALLVVVDDDVAYPPNFLRGLLAAHRRRPDAALGLRGVRRKPGQRFADLRHIFCSGIAGDVAVDILFGTWGYLLPPSAASAIPCEIAGANEAIRWVDDIWLSAQLARGGVCRFVIPLKGLPVETLAGLRGSLSGGLNRTGANEEAALEKLAEFWSDQPARPGDDPS